MAVDHNSATKDLHPQNLNRNHATAPAFPLHPSTSSLDDAEDDHSSRKVKLLCSFGGRILPRPSDCALRYAGGQTRMFTVRRDATFTELYRKMADAYGGPVAIRYQLPDQDLDALVSVSSAEDLDNMMDEYDKLAGPSGEGSAKLRIFLFSPSQVTSSASQISSAGMAVVDPYDSGQRYIEAVNGLAAMEIGGGVIRQKDSTASVSSTQNSDAQGDVSNNEGASPTIRSPTAAGMASLDPSRAAFVGNAILEPEYQSFRTNAATHNLNPPPVVPYASQAYIEPHQVQYITPSLAMAGGPQLINMVAVPHHPYISPVHIPPHSMSSHVGNLRQVQGKVESHFDENQYGGRLVPLVPDQSHKVFQQPLSQLPPLNPSQMQPQSIEPYGLHALLPLPKGRGIRLEDCQMCQKALPHAHSDTVINEQVNLSGASTREARPVVDNHSSEDITRLAQQRAVSVATMENLVEPKVESFVTSGQFGVYGANQIPEQILEKEKLLLPNAEGFDHSKSKQPQGPVVLCGDTQPSYGALVNPPKPHHEVTSRQQQEVLYGEYFDHAKVLHLPVTFGLSCTAHALYGESLGPSQPRLEETMQQKKVPQANNFDHVKVLRPPGTMGLTASTQTSYVISASHPQPYYEDSLLQPQQLPQATVPSAFPVKQENQKQLGQGSGSMENINYQVPEPVSNSVPVFPLDDGMMEAIRVSTFENFKLNDQLKPTVVSNSTVCNDMKPEKSLLVGDLNHTMRTHNGATMLISSNAFVSSGFVTEGASVAPVNPMFSNIGISKDMKPEICSVVDEANNNVRQRNGGNALFSNNAFPIPGVPPEANSVRLISPLLSTTADYMNLRNFEYASTALESTSVTNHGLFSKNFERSIDPAIPHDVMVGISQSYTDSAYRDTSQFPDGERRDEASVVHPKESNYDIAAIPHENMPFQFSHSSCTPGHMEQFRATAASDSLFCNQDPWKIRGSVHMYPPRPTIVANRESPYFKDMFIENFLPHSKDPDIAVLLEEGVLQPPADSLNKDSHSGPFIPMQDYVKQDLRDLAEQVGESVLQSITSASPLCSLEPDESSPSFNGTEIREDKSKSHSAAVLGDQKLEDIKSKQSDKAHFGIQLVDDLGRLQIIKNCDLEELRELGSGTFGTVYHGKWRGSDVAIKRINDRCFSGKPSEQERMRADFWNEASKLADLHHPNVVAFYGIVLDGPGGSFATVTEYMVNGSLRTVIQSNEKTFDRRKRLLIATDVAFGMEYLHGKNIVHFDLKSDNLLVNLRDPQRPICKVGDLGLSKVKCKTLISGGVRGTLPWMAPELLNGSSSLVSEKVDVFSFGIVMWELLTGQEPYADLHYGAIIGGIVNNTLRPPVPESCDPDWKALMEHCWSAEPSRRPSFTEIASRLRSMAASPPQKAQTSAQSQPQK